MKKVLFISLSPYTTIGGTQNYNYKLMKIFKKLNWDITEYNCNLGIDKINKPELKGVRVINNKSILTPAKNRFLEGRKFMRQVKSSNEDIKELIGNKYDLIIDSRQHPYFWKKQWGNNFALDDNTIWVQHFCTDLYDGGCISKNIIEKICIYFYTNKMNKNRYNVLYSHKNLVLFDKYNYESLDKSRFKIKPNINFINLSSYESKYIQKESNRKLHRDIDFLYVGRINQVQKNINFVNDVFKNSSLYLTMIGSGDNKYINKIKKNNNINYIGSKNPTELPEYYSRSKFLFIPSNYEGFPFTIVEALSHGCIPIILDTYDSAKFFKKIGYIFDKNIKPKQMRKELETILSLYKSNNSKNAYKFALKYLTNEEFEKKWIEIILKYNN